MKQIPLTQRQVALVDDEDYDRLMLFKWYAVHNSKWYACRKEGRKNKSLHREIIGDVPHPLVIDHINGDGLDCTKANMRICTQAENNRNSKAKRNGKIKYKGVSWHKASNSYVAQINTNGKVIHLGCFDLPEQAAVAYDEAAKKHFKEFALLNNVSGFDAIRRDVPKRKGSTKPAAKLNESQIPLIRESNLTYSKLAEMYGVSVGLIGFIKRRVSWKHVL